MQREISWDEFVKHSSEQDLWVLIEGHVYNLTEYASEHAEEKACLVTLAGSDATENFFKKRGVSPDALRLEIEKYKIGYIEKNEPASIIEIEMKRKQASLTKFTWKDVQKKNYFVMENYVYDLKETMKFHPKGSKIFRELKGTDVT